jgi:hypothetical protein
MVERRHRSGRSKALAPFSPFAAEVPTRKDPALDNPGLNVVYEPLGAPEVE